MSNKNKNLLIEISMSINRLNTNIDKNEETNLRIYFFFLERQIN